MKYNGFNIFLILIYKLINQKKYLYSIGKKKK